MANSTAIYLILMSGVSAVAPLAAQANCEYSRELSAALPIQPGEGIEVVARAGSLRITGRPDLTEVLVSGLACTSSEWFLNEMRVEAESRSGEVFVETHLPSSRESLGETGYARMDLVMEVPAIATLRVRDGSGSMEISGILGGMSIEDGSGPIAVSGTGGDVHISDGSGSIEVDNVRGSVIVEEDGSGSIEIRNVTGNVLVRRDGSGGIDVHQVSGDFTVERDGTGSINYGGIRGSVGTPPS